MRISTYSGRLRLLAILIALVSAVPYLPALGYDFVSFDDNDYITDNPYLRSPDIPFVKWAFVTFYPDNWFPIVWISYGVDYAIWGLNPMGYHLTNILLHMLNTLLVVLLTARLLKEAFGALNDTGFFMAALVGIIFGLHPLHVESVVWVSERKDVLYALFWLLSLLAYIKYAERGAFNKKLYYVLCLASFTFSLMSKPMAVTLPLVLLIIDWYPLKRLTLEKGLMRIAVMEKLPFYALSLGCAKLTMMAQSSIGAVISTDAFPFWMRFWVALKTLRFYIQKFILPMDLTPFYPLPEVVRPLSFEYLGSLVLLLGIIAACVAFIKRMPALMAAWIYFVITLLPVLGVVKVGFIIGADRYMYLPMLGPLMLVGMCVSRGWDSRKLRVYLVVSTAMLAVLLSVMTFMQGRIWRDSLALRYHMAMNVPKTPKPYAESAYEHLRAGRYQSAVKDLTEAIALVSGQWGLKYEPELHNYYHNRGNANFALKQYERAIKDFGMAISLKPDEAQYYFNRAIAYGRLQMIDNAISGYQRAVSINPDFAPAYNNMGTAYAKKGDYKKAIDNLNMAISLAGERSDYYYNRGQVHEIAGNMDLAIRDYRRSSRLGDKSATERLGSLGATP